MTPTAVDARDGHGRPPYRRRERHSALLGHSTWFGRLRLKYSATSADDTCVMADVRFAPPLQRLTSPPEGAPVPPPPPAVAAPPAPRLSPPIGHPDPRDRRAASRRSASRTSSQPKTDTRPTQAQEEARQEADHLRGVRSAWSVASATTSATPQPVQRVLRHKSAAAPLPAVPFVRPTVTSAEYSITLSAVQNGVPNNVTTKVRADYLQRPPARAPSRARSAGRSPTSQEIRTRDSIFRPGDGVRHDMDSPAADTGDADHVRHGRLHPDGQRHHRPAVARRQQTDVVEVREESAARPSARSRT